MRRIHSTVLVLCVVVLACAALRVLADDPASVNGDISILNDVHAGSNQKLMAVRHLWGTGRAGDLMQESRAIVALARQTHFDIEAVRALAYSALIGRLVKPEDGRRAPTGAAFDQAFRTAVPEWTVLGNIEDQLASSPSESPRFVIKHLAALAEQHPRLFDSLAEPLKSRLAIDLEICDREQPSVRLETLILLGYLGPTRASTFPIVLRGLADNNAKVRGEADRLLTDELGDLDATARASVESALIDQNQPIPPIAKPPVDPTLTKPMIASSVAQAVQDGDLSAIATLRDQHIDLKLFAAEVTSRLEHCNVRDSRLLLRGSRLAGLKDMLDEFHDLRKAVIDRLTIDDEATNVAAAALLVSPASREAGTDALISAIKNGRLLSPAMLKTFQPDAQQFSRQLTQPLTKGNLKAKSAALAALTVVGAPDPDVRIALNDLLRNPDPEFRLAAANALNTPEAIARASVPELLADLRNDNLMVRQLAARKLDGLHLEPKEFTTAVIRAVDQRDMASRHGLIAAMDRANLSGQNPIVVLKESAQHEVDPTRRVYARAALRAVEASGKPTIENVP